MGAKGNLTNYQIAGVVVAHSFLQGGPSFARLQRWVIQFFKDPTDIGLIKLFLTKHMVPKNAAIASTLELINKLEQCHDDNDINRVFENDAYMAIVNSTQWSITEVINIHSCHVVVGEILFNELVRKNRDQLMAFKDGLEVLGLLETCKRDAGAGIICIGSTLNTREFLVAAFSYANEEMFSNEQVIVKRWLLDYLDDISNEKATQLLRCVTSYEEVPSWGLDGEITLRFLPKLANKSMPEAMTCMRILYLPTILQSAEEFNVAMNAALSCGSQGFSLESDLEESSASES